MTGIEIEAQWDVSTSRRGLRGRPHGEGIRLGTRWRERSVAVVSVDGAVDSANQEILLDYVLAKVILCRGLILDLSAVPTTSTLSPACRFCRNAAPQPTFPGY